MSTNLHDDRYHILVEFAVKHMDFQQAELASVLDMVGIQLDSDVCRILPLPNSSEERRRPFLILSFKKGFKSSQCFVGDVEEKAEPPQRTLATIIMSRCTLVRSVVELWGSGSTMDACVNGIRQWIESPPGKDIFETNASETRTWKTTVHTLGTRYTREEQEEP